MDLKQLEVEFTELKNDAESRVGDEEEATFYMRESQLCNRHCEAVLAVTEPLRGLGTAETGPNLAPPYAFGDVEPLAVKRMRDYEPMRRCLAETLRSKWDEATTGPAKALTEMLEVGDVGMNEGLNDMHPSRDLPWSGGLLSDTTGADRWSVRWSEYMA